MTQYRLHPHYDGAILTKNVGGTILTLDTNDLTNLLSLSFWYKYFPEAIQIVEVPPVKKYKMIPDEKQESSGDQDSLA